MVEKKTTARFAIESPADDENSLLSAQVTLSSVHFIFDRIVAHHVVSESRLPIPFITHVKWLFGCSLTRSRPSPGWMPLKFTAVLYNHPPTTGVPHRASRVAPSS